MTWDTLIVSIVAFGLGMVTEVVRHQLSVKSERADRILERRQKELDVAYSPAIQILDRLMHNHPDCEADRESLRALIEVNSSLFDLTDLEQINKVFSRSSKLSDLVYVQRQLRLGALRRKQMLE